MRLILYFNFSRHFEKQGDKAVERLLQPFGLRNDGIARNDGITRNDGIARNDGITRNDNTPSDEKRQRLAFQAPQTAIKPGIKIMAQMILSKFALTQSILPNK